MLFNILDFENENFSSISDEQLKDLFDKLKSLIDSGDEELKNKLLDLIRNIDGSGSEIDADLLDGLDSSAFALADLSNVSNEVLCNKLKEIGSIENCFGGTHGTGDADTLEGLDSSQFLRRDISDYPTQDEQFDLGSLTNKWNNIYATTFQGNTLQVNNADLAEKYTCKDELEIGDVVCITEDSYFETEKCNEIASYKVVGVYSENPALIMNKNKRDGYTIAIRGKVPIKVIGKVNKGDPLVSYKDGYAVSAFNKELLKDLKIEKQMIIGKALENSNEQNNLIKAIII